MTRKLGTAWIGLALLTGALAAPVLGKTTEKQPACYGNDNFATQSALTQMVNTGLIKDFSAIYKDERNPYELKTTLLESQNIGKYSSAAIPEIDIYKQIQKINLRLKDGKAFEILTISEASFAECSLTEPTVILISPTIQILNAGKSIFTQR